MKRILFTLILVLLPLTALSGPDSDCMDIFTGTPYRGADRYSILAEYFLGFVGIILLGWIISCLADGVDQDTFAEEQKRAQQSLENKQRKNKEARKWLDERGVK